MLSQVSLLLRDKDGQIYRHCSGVPENERVLLLVRLQLLCENVKSFLASDCWNIVDAKNLSFH